MDLTVIVPTRHEAGNVAVVARRVAAALPDPGLRWQLVFVDDSDDDTVRVLSGLAASSPAIEMIHRRPGDRAGGLSGAVLAGLAATSSRWVAVMDADLQHPPELLALLLEPLMGGVADIAIASRYLPGASPGGLSGSWRKAVSAAARGAAWAALPRVRGVSDPLGGFFAFDRAVVTGVDLRPLGFKVLLEVLVRGRYERVAEVPYRFDTRSADRSKAGLVEGVRFGRHVGRLWRTAGRPEVAAARPVVIPAHRSVPNNAA